MAHHEEIKIGDHPDYEDFVEQIAKSTLPELIAPTRLARLLDMDRRRIYEFVETGELAAVRVGKRGIRVFRSSLLSWLRRRGCGS